MSKISVLNAILSKILNFFLFFLQKKKLRTVPREKNDLAVNVKMSPTSAI